MKKMFLPKSFFPWNKNKFRKTNQRTLCGGKLDKAVSVKSRGLGSLESHISNNLSDGLWLTSTWIFDVWSGVGRKFGRFLSCVIGDDVRGEHEVFFPLDEGDITDDE